MGGEEMRLMEQLLQKLSQRDLAAIFNQPVKASEYPDYHQIVSTPMDLGTIQENIRQDVYPSLEACAKDVRTVWTNAYLYNPAKSVVAQGARALSKVFEGMYNKINPLDFNYAREPNVDERNKFSRDIYRVEDSQLAEAVGLLEQRCPDAVVRDNEEGYVVVKVDALPSPVFWEVELYLRKRLCNQPDRTKKKIPTTFRPPPESMARISGRKRAAGATGGGGDGGDGGGTGGDSGGGENSKGSLGTDSSEAGSGGSGRDEKKRKTGEATAAAAAAAADDDAAPNGTISRSSGPDAQTKISGEKTSAGAAPAAGVGGGLGEGTDKSGRQNGSSAVTATAPAPAIATAPAADAAPAVAAAANTAASSTAAGSLVGAGSGGVGRGADLQADTSFREAEGGESVDNVGTATAAAGARQ